MEARGSSRGMSYVERLILFRSHLPKVSKFLIRLPNDIWKVKARVLAAKREPESWLISASVLSNFFWSEPYAAKFASHTINSLTTIIYYSAKNHTLTVIVLDRFDLN